MFQLKLIVDSGTITFAYIHARSKCAVHRRQTGRFSWLELQSGK